MWFWMYFNDNNIKIIEKIMKGMYWFAKIYGFYPEYVFLNPEQKTPVTRIRSKNLTVLYRQECPINNFAYSMEEWL